MADRLDEYRRKRRADRTPEPVPSGPLPRGHDDTFVIQQHHARRLHWDLRLERNGVLVSWAVPKGIPRDPATNHLAVHTEDHPLEYAEFAGDIPAGEYGAGHMAIYDRGTYETEKWRDDEVMVILRGTRVSGRYVLFHTSGKDWMIHRMDPPEAGWSPMPERIAPMLATHARSLPPDDDAWGYELAWHGLRAVAYVSGGQIRLRDGNPSSGGNRGSDGNRDHDRDDHDIIRDYPELRPIAEALAPVEAILDGEIVAFDDSGRISAAALRRRRAPADAAVARRLARQTPVQYLVFDLLWQDGEPITGLSYVERRELLDALALAGTHWQTPPHFTGGGTFAIEAARAQGLRGVVAKRLDSAYEPGRRRKTWLAIPA
jgi:bifunctional non-homologous end joining protein LigD